LPCTRSILARFHGAFLHAPRVAGASVNHDDSVGHQEGVTAERRGSLI
jgi:hypothetical protein